MTASDVLDVLTRASVGVGAEAAQSADGIPTIYLPLDRLVEACRVVRGAPELAFVLLLDIIPIDFLAARAAIRDHATCWRVPESAASATLRDASG